MDHPTVTQIENTGYPKCIVDISEDDAARSCDICDEPFVVIVKGVKYCRKCAKDARVLRTNKDPFYPNTLFEDDQRE